MSIRSFRHDQGGFTLVEMMLASAVGLLVLAGVVQIFIGSSANFRLQEGMAGIQESGRFALEYITRDLRKTGLAGCLFDRQFEDLDNDGVPDKPNIGRGLFVEPARVGVADISLLDGTEGGDDTTPDSISMIITVGDGADITPDINVAANTITLTGGVGLDEDDFSFILANCWRAELLRNADLNPEVPVAGGNTTLTVFSLPGNTTNYDDNEDGSQIIPAQWIRYDISDNNTLRRIIQHPADDDDDAFLPIAENITNLQIEYGELDLGDDTIQYKDADNTDMDNVISVRISLTANDPDIDQDRTFTSTVFLRNFVPRAALFN